MAKSFGVLQVLCLWLALQAVVILSSHSEVKLKRSRLPRRRVREKLQIQKELREPRTRFTGIFRQEFVASVALVDGNETAEELSRDLSYETAWPRNGRRKATIVKVLNHENAKKKTRERFPLNDSKDVPSFLKRHMYLRRNKREIFGRDNRFFIPARSFGQRFPFSSVVKISTGCSGALVSPRHAITAAHCIHTGKDYVKGFSTLQVGLLQKDGTFQWIDVSKTKMPMPWVKGQDKKASKYDYAILKLSRRHHRPYIPITVSEGYRHGRGDRIHFTAFEDDKPRNTIWYRFCRVEDHSADMLCHFCDAKPGSSGAGVYVYHYDTYIKAWKRRIVGVFSGNRWIYYPYSWYMRPRNYNVATRITTLKFAQICGWIGPRHWPRECSEYVNPKSITKMSSTTSPKNTTSPPTNTTSKVTTKSVTGFSKTTVKTTPSFAPSTVLKNATKTQNETTEHPCETRQHVETPSPTEPSTPASLSASPGRTKQWRKERKNKKKVNKKKRIRKQHQKSEQPGSAVTTKPITKPCDKKATESQPRATVAATSPNEGISTKSSLKARRERKQRRNRNKMKRHKKKTQQTHKNIPKKKSQTTERNKQNRDRVAIQPTPTNRSMKGRILKRSV